MFGLRRSAGAQPAPPDPSHSPIRADFTGATVTGQVAVGKHIVQIQAEAGGNALADQFAQLVGGDE